MKSAAYKKRNVRGMFAVLGMVVVLCGITLDAEDKVWHFDHMAAGKLPAGWEISATNSKGPLASWEVVEEKSAPSPSHILALTNTNHNDGATFNLCWRDDDSFLDGEIEVKFKARSGSIDQGGGVMWRVQDSENYYVARFNPLEDNFRLYFVKEGKRVLLEDAHAVLDAGRWHTMKIVQKGNHYMGYLDGKKYIEGSDNTFTKRGGTGLWTKADAVTSFDDFSVKTK